MAKKKVSKKRRPADPVQRARQILEEAIGHPLDESIDINELVLSLVDNDALKTDNLPSNDEKDSAAVALGRKGGQKGGPARAKKLSVARRKAIARKAAQARWKKEKDS